MRPDERWVEYAVELVQSGVPVVPVATPDADGRCHCRRSDCPGHALHALAEPWASDVLLDGAVVSTLREYIAPCNVAAAIGPDWGLAAVRVRHRSPFERVRLATKTLGARVAACAPAFLDDLGTDDEALVLLVQHPFPRAPDDDAPPAADVRRGAVEILLAPQLLALPVDGGPDSHAAYLSVWNNHPRATTLPEVPRRLLRTLHVAPGTSAEPVVADRGEHLLTVRELVRQAADSEFVLAPWVPMGGVALLVGHGKRSGLTQFCLHAAASLEFGHDFLGEIQWGARVLYVTEQSQSSFVASVESARLDADGSLGHVYVLPLDAWDRPGPAELVHYVGQMIQRHEIGLVIIDSVEGVLGDAAGAQPAHIAHLLLRLTGPRCGVLATTRVPAYHAADDALHALGALAAVADSVTLLQPAEGSPSTRLLLTTARQRKPPPYLLVDFDAATGRYVPLSAGASYGPLFAGTPPPTRPARPSLPNARP